MCEGIYTYVELEVPNLLRFMESWCLNGFFMLSLGQIKYPTVLVNKNDYIWMILF